MSSINDTIRAALGEDISRSYSNYVSNVVDALQQREDQIKQRLTNYAVGRGLRPAEINRILDEAGLNDRVLETTAAEAHENSSVLVRLAQQLSEQVADLNRRIQNL